MIPIRAVHQIEITSRCNLRCKYCVSPNLQRPKLDMSWSDFKAAIDWVKYFQLAHGQAELNLAGIGESTIHPEFIPFLKYARLELGADIRLVLATNGVAVTQELVDAMKPWNPHVWVSFHRPEKAGPALEKFALAGMAHGYSTDSATGAMDWAGQVDPKHLGLRVGPGRQCDWVRAGKVMVMADGRITRCCLDGSGVGVLGTIKDDLRTIQTTPYSLCRSCDMDVGMIIPPDGPLTIAKAPAFRGIPVVQEASA